MASKAKKLMNEQAEFLGEQVRVLRGAPGTLVRQAAARSAQRVKALKKPARVVTRSGVRLTTLSQDTVQSLLELQLEIVTSVLTNAATQLERVSRARSVRDAVGGQADELRAARDRIRADIRRVIQILRRAGKGVRSVATEAYASARGPEAEEAPVPVRRKRAKRPVRKVKRAK